MATYLELANIRNQPDESWNEFSSKCVTATAIKASAIINTQSPNAGLLGWANQAIKEPVVAANDLISYVIATNSSRTINQILGAADSGQNSIQEAIDAAVDALYTSA